MVLGTHFPAENWMHSGGTEIHLTWLFNRLHELSKAWQPSFCSIPFVVPVCPQRLGSLSLLQSNAEPPPYTAVLAQGFFSVKNFAGYGYGDILIAFLLFH